MTEAQIKKTALELGGFYETGAWRFPTVWAKEEFLRRISAK